MAEQRIRWFRPTMLLMALLGAFVGWFKDSGSARDDFLGAIVGAALGYVLGVGLDVAFNGSAPAGSEERPLAPRERRLVALLVVVVVALAFFSVLAL